MGQDAACAAALLALCFYVLPADSASCSNLSPLTKNSINARAPSLASTTLASTSFPNKTPQPSSVIVLVFFLRLLLHQGEHTEGDDAWQNG